MFFFVCFVLFVLQGSVVQWSEHEFWSQKVVIHILIPLLTSCVSLGILLGLSVLSVFI